jgi:hypothetical protein
MNEHKLNYRKEMMSEIFSEIGIVATSEQIESIINDYHDGLYEESELLGFLPQNRTHIEPKCQKCEQLKAEIKSLCKDISVYKDNVKRRRGAEHVWIEGDDVKYM